MAVPPVPPLLVVVGLDDEQAVTDSIRVKASTRIFMLTFLPCFMAYTY
jgi:hypothetical protein